MSPDDILAAQFWPWPDPPIKRDGQGRVLFVNAAFLALYGGKVEDWRGNAVGGWPAPQGPASAPYRFETRLPGADGSEQVYDWMEQSMADGTAFALARNVTVFTHMPEPDPAHIAAPAQNYEQAEAQTEAPPQQEPAQHAPAYEPALAQIEAPAHEDAASAPPPAAPAIADAPMLQADPQHIAVPDIEIPSIEIPSDDAYALTDTAPAEPAPDAEAPREFERRALPLAEDSAVLGNNWRDAVIAKAVGAEEVAASVAPETSAETAAPAAAQSGEDGGPVRILLAEDNAINALLTRTLLEAEGHVVNTVEDGALAVEAMKSSTYDLIFMDMRMPNMDGLESTRKIRTLPNVSRALPIIALTANAFDDDRNACFDSGMNDFMTKPVSAEELSEKVRNWTSPEAKARMAKAA